MHVQLLIGVLIFLVSSFVAVTESRWLATLRKFSAAAAKRLGVLLAVVPVAALASTVDPLAFTTLSLGGFGTVDLDTGTYTQLGISQTQLDGLGVLNGTLYGLQHGGPENLYSVDPTDGHLTAIGLTGLAAGSNAVFGSTATGLYAVVGNGHGSSNLYGFNATTGAATLIGSTGLGIGNFETLSTNSSSLFLDADEKFYSLNTSTGAPTLIGNSGLNGPRLSALMFEDGTLWGASNAPGLPAVATIDTATGAGSIGAPFNGAHIGGGALPAGFAPVPPPVPLPPAVWLLVSGLGGIYSFSLRSKRKAASP